MGMFQALLLAASLGWSTLVVGVGATPQAPPPAASSSIYIPATQTPTRVTRVPHIEVSQHNLDVPSSTPATTYPVNASPVTMYTQSSLTYDHGPSPTGPPTPPNQSGGESTLPPSITPPYPPPPPPTTGPAHPPPGTLTAPSASTASGSGGILFDTAPPPTAIRTYFVSGHPVIAGAPATVVDGTTWKFPASGTKLYADGTATAVSDAIIGGSSATVSGTGDRAAGATGTASTNAAAGGVRVSGGWGLAVAGGVMGIMGAAL